MHQARRQAGKEWGEEARAICVPVGPGGYGGTARSRPPRGPTAGTPAYGEAAGRQRPCTSKQYDAPQDIYAGRAFEGVTRGGMGPGGLGIFPGKRDAHAAHNGSNNPPPGRPSRALGKTSLTRSQSAAPPANGRGIYDLKMRTSVSGSLAPRPARTMPCSSCGASGASGASGAGSAGGAGGAGAGSAVGLLRSNGSLSRPPSSSLLGPKRPSSGRGRASAPSATRAYLTGDVPLRGGSTAADKDRGHCCCGAASEAGAGVGGAGPPQRGPALAARGAAPEGSPFKKGGSPFGAAALRRSQSPLYAAPPMPPMPPVLLIPPRAATIVPIAPATPEALSRGPVASAATGGGDSGGGGGGDSDGGGSDDDETDFDESDDDDFAGSGDLLEPPRPPPPGLRLGDSSFKLDLRRLSRLGETEAKVGQPEEGEGDEAGRTHPPPRTSVDRLRAEAAASGSPSRSGSGSGSGLSLGLGLVGLSSGRSSGAVRPPLSHALSEMSVADISTALASNRISARDISSALATNRRC